MGIAFMHIEKIKNPTSLTGIYMHNYRVNDVINADKNMERYNEELVKLEQKNYYAAFRERVAMLEEMYPDKKILRKNGTPAIEVITSMPRSDMSHVDIEKWKQDNVQWLRDTFNRDSEKHGENVISVMYHGDEAGSVHCHAIVLPIDEKGVFNYSAFVNGRDDARQLQRSYGDLMETNHELERGIEGSRTKHEDIKRFYTQLNQNLRIDDIPKPMENESREDYLLRIEDFFKDVRAGALKRQKELEWQLDKYKSLSQQKDFEYYQVEQRHREAVQKYESIVEKYAGGDERAFVKTLEDTEKVRLFVKMGADKKEKDVLEGAMQQAIIWSEKHLNPQLYEMDLFLDKERDKEKEMVVPEHEVEVQTDEMFMF